MTAPLVIFWIVCAFCVYAYVGYPLLIWLLGACRSSRKANQPTPGEWPSVSLICCAYNEEAVIRQKMQSCLDLDYPCNRLEVIVVSDASTDQTDSIIREYATWGIKLLRQPVRSGLVASQNLAASQSCGEIIVLCDANSLYERYALRHLIIPFADPTVGAVIGRLQNSNPQATWVSRGETLYWRYEAALKKAQASAGALLFGIGAMTAVRRSLFRPLIAPWQDHDTLAPLKCRMAGYQVAFAPKAIAWEEASTQGKKEFQRKVRTAMRDATTFLELKFLLSPLRPWLAFNLFSSKVLRWLAGSLLVLLLGANGFLLDAPFYRLTMAIQAAFYGLAMLGLGFPKVARVVRFLSIPAYFCLVNAAATVALGRLLAGQQVIGTWEPRGG